MHCNPAFWLAESPSPNFHRVVNQVILHCLDDFPHGLIQDDRHYYNNPTRQNGFNIITVYIFGSLNMQIDAFFPSESVSVFVFPFWYIVKKLSIKQNGAMWRLLFYTSADGVSPLTLKWMFKRKW